jgi:molybdopterin-containing oxidoreductase family membrane subunit
MSPENVHVPAESLGALTDAIAAPVLSGQAGRRWWLAFAAGLLLVLVTAAGIVYLVAAGIGVWGVNSTVVWGYAIASYVWWIAIGSGGTLISSILVLTRQDWRRSINRFAEAMTVFAVAIAGLYPILHLGRPQYFYWLAPYPNTMGLWPQWRSALVWDFWAILCYLLFSLLFLFVGLLPDLATLRDGAASRGARLAYGLLALGWRGSARQWQAHQILHRTLAAIAVPLVVSVHSIVGLDFAASLMPGWQESIFPPYFVLGALFSGFAMVVLLSLLVRWGMGLRDLITPLHFEAMAKVILMGSVLMTLCYATEWFMAWYGGGAAERSLVAFLFTGAYAPLYWIQLTCNCLLPQALWFAPLRRSPWALGLVAVAILAGMWLERILIIWGTLSHDTMPTMWRLFQPTISDWALLVGPFGLFACLYLAFLRLLPAVSMHDMRSLVSGEGRP